MYVTSMCLVTDSLKNSFNILYGQFKLLPKLVKCEHNRLLFSFFCNCNCNRNKFKLWKPYANNTLQA